MTLYYETTKCWSSLGWSHNTGFTGVRLGLETVEDRQAMGTQILIAQLKTL